MVMVMMRVRKMSRRATVPDLAYIRDRIPIREVAMELGLEREAGGETPPAYSPVIPSL